MKKQLKVIAVALSSVLLLSACGGKTATTSPSSSPAETRQQLLQPNR